MGLINQGATDPVEGWELLLAEINPAVTSGDISPSQVSPDIYEGHAFIYSTRPKAILYNTNNITAEELPDTAFDWADPQFHGRYALPPWGQWEALDFLYDDRDAVIACTTPSARTPCSWAFLVSFYLDPARRDRSLRSKRCRLLRGELGNPDAPLGLPSTKTSLSTEEKRDLPAYRRPGSSDRCTLLALPTTPEVQALPGASKQAIIPCLRRHACRSGSDAVAGREQSRLFSFSESQRPWSTSRGWELRRAKPSRIEFQSCSCSEGSAEAQ